MALLDRLEHKWQAYLPANVSYYVIGGQILTFALSYANPQFTERLTLQGNLVLAGQWWRVLTVLFVPITISPFFFALALYFYYLISKALETEWGVLRYLLYLLIGYGGTVTSAFLFSSTPLTNFYIFHSLFLAFAYVFPYFKVLLFFIFPIQVKWLGLLAWLGLAVTFIGGSMETKVLSLISVANFLLFFGKDLLRSVKRAKPRLPRESAQSPHFTCPVCKQSRKIFSYCKICDRYYCQDHIDNHQHLN